VPIVSARVAAMACAPGSDPDVRVNSRDAESDMMSLVLDVRQVSTCELNVIDQA
jgi:hypothetical protein